MASLCRINVSGVKVSTEDETRAELIPGLLQSAEVGQGDLVDAAEASHLLGLCTGQVPSAGSGYALESNTGELYINSRDKSRP